MAKYWLFALVAHPVRAARLLLINRHQWPPSGRLRTIGRFLFQADFIRHFPG